jgi:hypothetical protein
MCYKPLPGWLIWAYKPSQAVIGLVMAYKELPRVEIQDGIKLNRIFSHNFLELSTLSLCKPLIFANILRS